MHDERADVVTVISGADYLRQLEPGGVVAHGR
jgi:hypothetical protein